MHDKGRKLFGRKLGHKLSPTRQAIFETRLPDLQFDPRTALAAQFDHTITSYALEIGFGAGEHLLARAKANPQCGFIGCEVFINGVARLVADIDAAAVKNIRLHFGDARELLPDLPSDCLDNVYLLYPDPWPKRRHHKRRFIAPETLCALWRVMRPNAALQIASDSPDYVSWSLMQMRAFGGFAWRVATPQDWRVPPHDWTATRYEKKALRAGRAPTYLQFQRREKIIANTL